MKNQHIEHTRAAQISLSIEGRREGGLRGALTRRGGGGGAGAGAHTGRRMARCAFPGFWTLGSRKIDRMALPATGLTGLGERQGEARRRALRSTELTGLGL
jgi:hypothetical protein